MEKLLAPIEIEMKIFFTDGRKVGTATIRLGYGHVPTEKEILERVKKFRDDEMANLAGNNFKLMTAEEFFNHIVQEQTGSSENFAIPAKYRSYSSDL